MQFYFHGKKLYKVALVHLKITRMANQSSQESSMPPIKKVKENKNIPSKPKSVIKITLTVVGEVLLFPVAVVVCTALFPFSFIFYMVSSMNQKEKSDYIPPRKYKENKTSFGSKLKLNFKKTLGTALLIWALPLLAIFPPRIC